MYSNVIDFTKDNIPTIPLWLQNKSNIRLILWAGDGCHNEIVDVERLRNYDIYFCYNTSGKLRENDNFITTRNIISCICICDYKNMDNFLSIFGNRFSVVDSDYYGNTPTLPLESYSKLLQSGGIGYHIKGINGGRYPAFELSNVLELFAPILPTKLNDLRLWTGNICKIACANGIPLQWVYTDTNLPINYKNIQDKFKLEQERQFPQLNNSKNYSIDNIENYWDTLSIKILIINLTAYTWLKINQDYNWIENELLDGSFIEPYKQRFCNYLYSRIKNMITNQKDFEMHMTELTNIDDKIRKLQSILEMVSYDIRIHNMEARIGYYMDERVNKRLYGLTIHKT
jgi:hypothetical protein